MNCFHQSMFCFDLHSFKCFSNTKDVPTSGRNTYSHPCLPKANNSSLIDIYAAGQGFYWNLCHFPSVEPEMEKKY